VTDRNQIHSDWPRLFRIACNLIDQVNADQCIIRYWSLGGGTAMMLQIAHRESHDVDIFFEDPQVLPFLNPDTHDFTYEITPSEYKGDGTTHLKFSFEKIGEIDFIVAPHLTANPTTKRDVENVSVFLETLPEIIAKKICHRGHRITPRDIFDLAAASRVCRDDIVTALSDYPEQARASLSYMEQLSHAFVKDAISELMIRVEYQHLVESSLEEARALLSAVR